jgi:transposase
MYVSVSRYKNYQRVRIIQKQKIDGVFKSKLVEHIGSARNETDLLFLKEKARQRIIELSPQLSLLDESSNPSTSSDSQPLELRDPFAYGLWQVMGGIYNQLDLPDNLLKYLVLARTAIPKSKRATVRYLMDNLRCSTTLTDVYRFMDTIDKDQLTTILLAYAQKQAQSQDRSTISVVFYDVTTLYFETNEDDEDTINLETGEVTATGLRKKGYSKDHRYDLPQVVVGLTVNGNGFPLDFQVYEGNTYEGHTLLSGIEKICTKLQLASSKLTVVADAGMLSRANLEVLEAQGFRYIVGARIRSLATDTAEQITSWNYAERGNLDTTIAGRRMIVTYSHKRAERSHKNRERLVKKLQAKLNRGQVVKKSKYVLLDNNKKLTGQIDQAKLIADASFDGLKGYVTNTTLPADKVVTHYSNLWHVEKSFRMSKSDLQARPTFHFKRNRIIAHLTICVCALGVLRLFEEQLNTKLPGVGLSVALEQLLAVREYKAFLNGTVQITSITQLTDLQRQLLKLRNIRQV